MYKVQMFLLEIFVGHFILFQHQSLMKFTFNLSETSLQLRLLILYNVRAGEINVLQCWDQERV